MGKSPTERQKKVFYELIADKVQERTSSGKDIEGNSFTQYSKEYAKSKGVTRGSVDLILTGEMLTSFEDSQGQQNNMVKIKLSSDETLKGYNHNVGDTLPKRTFFGVIKDDEINNIIDQVKSVESSEPTIRLSDLRAAVNTISVTLGDDDGEV